MTSHYLKVVVKGFKKEVEKKSQVTVMQLNNMSSGMPTLQKAK